MAEDVIIFEEFDTDRDGHKIEFGWFDGGEDEGGDGGPIRDNELEVFPEEFEAGIIAMRGGGDEGVDIEEGEGGR